MEGVRLAQVARGRNIFDVLRLAAAVAVLVSHCFALTGRSEPFAELTGETLGELGVSVFFAISGFLIVRSWEAQPELRTYAIKRALRLLPALVVVAFLMSFVLGPLVTSWSLRDYFTNPQPYVYAVRCSVLVTVAGHLPGVFAHNPFPAAVNGSLWTLPVEASAYVLVAALGLTGMLARRRAVGAVLVVLVVLALPQFHIGSTVTGSATTTAGGSLGLVMHLLALFVAGGLLWLHRDRVRLSWWIAMALAAAWVASWGTDWVTTTATLFIPYAVLVLAYRGSRRLMALVAVGDVSYGIYVYAFPVQQVVAQVGGPATRPLVMLAVALPVVYLLALVSWRLVERPALAYKRMLTSRS